MKSYVIRLICHMRCTQCGHTRTATYAGSFKKWPVGSMVSIVCQGSCAGAERHTVLRYTTKHEPEIDTVEERRKRRKLPQIDSGVRAGRIAHRY